MEDNKTAVGLLQELETSTGYLVAITFLKDGVLTHHFLTNNFPTGDIKTSMEELKKLSKQPQVTKVSEKVDEHKK